MRRLPTKFKLIMLNFIIIVLSILLTQNIILVNEESLILICFFITLTLLINNFNYLTDSLFQKYANNKRNDVISTLSLLVESLQKFIQHEKNLSFLSSITAFRNYIVIFTSNMVYWNFSNTFYKIGNLYYLCFTNFKNLEAKTIKFSANFIHFKVWQQIRTLNSLKKLNFTNNLLEIQNLIILREWIMVKKNW